jgi:membrane-associated phospholipid phosphatase
MKEWFYFIYNKLGEYGPLILIIQSIVLLKEKQQYLFYFIYGYFLNILLNLCLKGLIQQPRPLENHKLFELAIKNGKRFIFKNGLPHDIFGMPSGHSQSVLYTTCFIYSVFKKYNILIPFILISMITLCQRVTSKMHSIPQIIVGSIVGIIFGYFTYYIAKKKNEGVLKEKLDDNAPI